VKPLFWISSSKKDVMDFPQDVITEVGYALFLAQKGDKGINAVPMVGFGSSKVLEAVLNDTGETFRAVYTVKFADAVYVLHAFQKKSKKGVGTPLPEMELIRSRLKIAEVHYELQRNMVRKVAKNDRSA
jgi:phage-related protein